MAEKYDRGTDYITTHLSRDKANEDVFKDLGWDEVYEMHYEFSEGDEPRIEMSFIKKSVEELNESKNDKLCREYTDELYRYGFRNGFEFKLESFMTVRNVSKATAQNKLGEMVSVGALDVVPDYPNAPSYIVIVESDEDRLNNKISSNNAGVKTKEANNE